jgi:transcriptional regulator with XRE-family HTH domain
MHAIHNLRLEPEHGAMNHRKTLGRVIAQFRKAAGKMTQLQLSERTGIDQGALSRIENGRQGVSDDQMVAIARAIGVHVSEIWGAVEEAKGVAEDAAPYYRPPHAAGARTVPLIGWV